MPQLINSEMIRTLKSVFLPLPANLGARVFGSTQSIANAAYGDITFDTERWDTGSTGAGGAYPNGMWDVATPKRLTAVHRGWHTISGHIEFAYHAVGRRGIQIRHTIPGGAVTEIARSEWDAIKSDQVTQPMSITTQYWMNAGEYVELMAFQDSGAGLNVNEVGNYSPEFVMVRIP